MSSSLVHERALTTLLNMLQKNNLEDISVSMLCKEAQISRTSYYRHYYNVTDILNEELYECTEGIRKQLLRYYSRPIQFKLNLILYHSIDMVTDHKEYFKTFSNIDWGSSRYVTLFQNMYHFIDENFLIYLPNEEDVFEHSDDALTKDFIVTWMVNTYLGHLDYIAKNIDKFQDIDFADHYVESFEQLYQSKMILLTKTDSAPAKNIWP